MRTRVGDAIGRWLVPDATSQEMPAPAYSEKYPVNVSGFYESYTEERDRLAAASKREGIDLASDVVHAATLSMRALTHAASDRSRHGLKYINGFAYPEVFAARQSTGDYVDPSTIQLHAATRDTAIEFTQGWIIHGSQPHPERRPDDILSPEYTLDSFRHLGCSLTVDCLPAGISFEDLGVQVTPEIADMKPSSVFTYLEIDSTMFPESNIIGDVKDAFSQRAATW
jgi:hypothetical protein